MPRKNVMAIDDAVDEQIGSVLNRINRDRLFDTLSARISASKRATKEKINHFIPELRKFCDTVELSLAKGEVEIESSYPSVLNKLIFGSDWFNGFGKVELAEFIVSFLGN